ncbi:MAG TPA: helix-hairpin-helix domain-containing protein [Candidatus Sumerlaeota bacterium]|nr:helix-hairpin-helix domain-containing protein [Candidatus Sumerlaeota bacterium]HOR26454.1 helix-hairpin-helix domain-containing protein [Candidatus Sumerlaeota bacterium]HPK00838.1 helix-hairpin-helix domain-containing protein [Candidatus Sumerlaeota bacterium]
MRDRLAVFSFAAVLALVFPSLPAAQSDKGSSSPSLLDRLYPDRQTAEPVIDLSGLDTADTQVPSSSAPAAETAAPPGPARLILRRPAPSAQPTEDRPSTATATLAADEPTTAQAPVGLAPAELAAMLKATPMPRRLPPPAIDLGTLAEAATTDEDRPTTATRTADAPPPAPVRVNVASQQELARNLRIDPRRARLIIQFRETYGPFRGPDDLEQVTGITDGMVRAWETAGLLRFD